LPDRPDAVIRTRNKLRTTMRRTGGLFYLLTAENRLAEEGTIGTDSDGGERANDSPCP
jgi:hypothetical protein